MDGTITSSGTAAWHMVCVGCGGNAPENDMAFCQYCRQHQCPKCAPRHECAGKRDARLFNEKWNPHVSV